MYEFKTFKKVQLRFKPYTHRKMTVQYRIDPSEFNWFKRIFNLGWKTLNAYYGTYSKHTHPKSMYFEFLIDYHAQDTIRERFKTIADINSFIHENNEKYLSDIQKYKSSQEKHS